MSEIGKQRRLCRFTLDDILVNFDPVRTEHALAALGEIAGEGQILYFTSHPFVGGMCRSLELPHYAVDLHPNQANDAKKAVVLRQRLFCDSLTEVRRMSTMENSATTDLARIPLEDGLVKYWRNLGDAFSIRKFSERIGSNRETLRIMIAGGLNMTIERIKQIDTKKMELELSPAHLTD